MGVKPLPELDRPVFVTGTPRSGKSLVCKVLSRANEFHFAQEPLSLWDAGFGFRSDDCRGAADAKTAAARRAVRRAAEMTAAAGKRRYMDDLAYHALRLPFLAHLVPDAKVVLTISNGEHAIPEMIHGWTNRELMIGKRFAYRRRNIRLATLPRLAFRFVRNVAASRFGGTRVSWGPRVPGQREFAASHSPAVVAAHQWMTMIETALRDSENLDSLQVLEVRYERLLAAPETEARRIGEFCMVEAPDQIAAYATTCIDPSFQHEWKAFPTDEEWSEIRQLIAPLQQRLGYWSDDEASHAPNPAKRLR